MNVSNTTIYNNNFNSSQEAFDLKKVSNTSFDAWTILSYAATFFAAVSIDCCDDIIDCISKKVPSSHDQKVSQKAKETLSNKTNETQPISVDHIGTTQPEIISDDWKTITLKINGLIKTFKDVVILPSDDKQIAEEWNWKWCSDSMHHHPGIRISDVEHLIFSKTPKPDVIILTQGRGYGGQRENSGPGILEVAPGVREYIESKGVSEIYILKTAAAIEKYNEIRKEGKKRIAALIHTTC